MNAVKKFFPLTEHAGEVISEQLPHLESHKPANYFVEVQDQLLTNVSYKEGDELDKVNQDLQSVDPETAMKIGLVYMGRQAPGVNNVVDGLLRFKAQKNCKIELLGFINGVDGLLKEDFEYMTRDTYQHYNNLGGIDYIGRGFDELRSDFQKQKAAEVCTKLGLDGLVMVGATTCMTDAAHLSEFFLVNKVQTRIIVIPGTVDGNIHHKYISSAIGFDSASKVYS